MRRTRQLRHKPLVVYWNNIPAPYMVERFNALADRGNLNFEAWFNDRIAPDRSWLVDETSWRFQYRYLPVTKVLGRVQHWPTPVMWRRPDMLVSLYAQPVFLFGWAIAKLCGIKTVFWCEVTFDQWVARKWWKELLKRMVFPGVDATLGSGEEGRRFAINYGVPYKKAMCLRHVIDVQHFSSGHQKYRPARKIIRDNLGVSGVVFIYVGRFWWGKGVNYLLDAFEVVQRKSDSVVSLLLVGDGPEEEMFRQSCVERDISNVIFVGFQQKAELPRYYVAADVFVFPTLGDPYGLVVDEAMASSLPIISTSAAGEIRDRVEEKINGYIVPPKDVEALADRMFCFVENTQLCDQMGSISAEKIVGHTPEHWAEDFEEISKSILVGKSI